MVIYKRGLRNDPARDILVAAFEIENEQTFHLKELYKYLVWQLEIGAWKLLAHGLFCGPS